MCYTFHEYMFEYSSIFEFEILLECTNRFLLTLFYHAHISCWDQAYALAHTLVHTYRHTNTYAAQGFDLADLSTACRK